MNNTIQAKILRLQDIHKELKEFGILILHILAIIIIYKIIMNVG